MIFRIIDILLYPFSLLYQFLFYLKYKMVRVNRIQNSIVISVGNLSVGGTGKTPHIIYLAELFKKKLKDKRQITVLTRGYGGAKSAEGIVVESDTDPALAGDEPVLIKKSVPFVRVIAGKKRLANFLRLGTRSENNIILLDDGFQHFSIHRDLDIVLIDSVAGLGNGFTLPAGRLREPLSALKRAHAVIFTKCEKRHHPHELEDRIREVNPAIRMFYSRYVAEYLSDGVTRQPVHDLHGKRVLLFSGIARPSSFIQMVRDHEPEELRHIDFRDHMRYTEKTVNEITGLAADYDLVVCTEKDFVKISKLGNAGGILFLGITLTIENENGFVELITNVK